MQDKQGDSGKTESVGVSKGSVSQVGGVPQMIKAIKINEDAIIPIRKGSRWEIICPKEIVLNSGDLVIVGSGWRLELPYNIIVLLNGRGVTVDPLEFIDPSLVRCLGLELDNSYKGEWGIAVKNFSSSIVQLNIGDVIGTFVFLNCYNGVIFV